MWPGGGNTDKVDPGGRLVLHTCRERLCATTGAGVARSGLEGVVAVAEAWDASLGWEQTVERDAAPVRPRRRWPYVVVIVVLVAAVAGAGTALVQSSRAAEGWRAVANQRAADLAVTRGQRDALGSQLSAANSQLSAAKGQLVAARSTLAETTAKFNSASARIRALAAEKAQVGDQAALLAESVALSKRVSAELDTCVNNLQQLESYLVDFQNYDTTSLVAFTSQINAGCDQARSDNATLVQQLGTQ